MGGKQIGGPVAAAILVVVALLVVGFGYYFLNKDHMGKEAEARKAGRPGVVPQGADPNMGPFPSDTRPDGVKMAPGTVPGVGAVPQGAAPPGK